MYNLLIVVSMQYSEYCTDAVYAVLCTGTAIERLSSVFIKQVSQSRYVGSPCQQMSSVYSMKFTYNRVLPRKMYNTVLNT